MRGSSSQGLELRAWGFGMPQTLKHHMVSEALKPKPWGSGHQHLDQHLESIGSEVLVSEVEGFSGFRVEVYKLGPWALGFLGLGLRVG